ncbi:MAG: hypothetical protein CMJ84_06220 [Planctomycetes bacterium]|jgi:hypothetical protein|nr:hypothetical protein [Planctomycetota bacterium]MDP6408290.1 hypothetical protein [Planctomycetota bacterium]
MIPSPLHPFRALSVLLFSLVMVGCSVTVTRSRSSHISDWALREGGVASTSHSEGGVTEYEVRWMEGGVVTELHTLGEVEFRPDERGVERLIPGGFLRVERMEDSGRWALSLEPAEDGALLMTFTRHGGPAEFDAEAEEAFAEIIAQVFRFTPLGAEPRVRRLLAEGGAQRVLDEAGGLAADSVRRVYYSSLIEAHGDDAAVVRAAVECAADSISSTSGLASLLISAVERAPQDHGLTATLCEASARLSTNSSRAELVEAIAARRVIDENDALHLLEAVAGLSTMSIKSRLLVDLLDDIPPDDAILREVLRITLTITSPKGLADTLHALYERRGLSDELRLDIVSSLTRISSNGMRTSLLVHMLRTAEGSERFFSVALKVADGISSISGKEQALDALLDRDDLDRATLEQAGKVIARISSSSARSRLRQRLLEQAFDD